MGQQTFLSEAEVEEIKRKVAEDGSVSQWNASSMLLSTFEQSTELTFNQGLVRFYRIFITAADRRLQK